MPGIIDTIVQKKQALKAELAMQSQYRGRSLKRVQFQNVRWLTTAPHPTRPAHTHSADDGQVGWRLHLVMATQKQHDTRPYPKAVCGTRAKHGWGLDLFIDEPCERCIRAAIKRNLTVPAIPE